MHQGFAGDTQAGSAASALPKFSFVRNHQRPEEQSAGGNKLLRPALPGSLPCSVLSHPRSAAEMQHFSPLLREIRSRAINTYPLGRNFPANFGFCPGDKSLDTAALGDPLSTGTQPQASASSSAPRMRFHVSRGAGSPPARAPPGTGVRDVYLVLVYPNVPPAFDILKNTVTRLDLFLALLQPCVQSSNTYLFHSTARKVSKPL